MRLKQEVLLGIGGYRTLEAMGLEPTVYHMNEGHSAFLSLERVVRLMETQELSFDTSRLIFSASGFLPRSSSASGGQNPANDGEDFCMTVLALRLACFSNGVSKLHGEVSRRMWSNLWQGVPESEAPIEHVTKRGSPSQLGFVRNESAL